jgi:hypothetical protein
LIRLSDILPLDSREGATREPHLDEGEEQAHIENIVEHEEGDNEEKELAEQPVLTCEPKHYSFGRNHILKFEFGSPSHLLPLLHDWLVAHTMILSQLWLHRL